MYPISRKINCRFSELRRGENVFTSHVERSDILRSFWRGHRSSVATHAPVRYFKRNCFTKLHYGPAVSVRRERARVLDHARLRGPKCHTPRWLCLRTYYAHSTFAWHARNCERNAHEPQAPWVFIPTTSTLNVKDLKYPGYFFSQLHTYTPNINVCCVCFI